MAWSESRSCGLLACYVCVLSVKRLHLGRVWDTDPKNSIGEFSLKKTAFVTAGCRKGWYDEQIGQGLRPLQAGMMQ